MLGIRIPWTIEDDIVCLDMIHLMPQFRALVLFHRFCLYFSSSFAIPRLSRAHSSPFPFFLSVCLIFFYNNICISLFTSSFSLVFFLLTPEPQHSTNSCKTFCLSSHLSMRRPHTIVTSFLLSCNLCLSQREGATYLVPLHSSWWPKAPGIPSASNPFSYFHSFFVVLSPRWSLLRVGEDKVYLFAEDRGWLVCLCVSKR